MQELATAISATMGDNNNPAPNLPPAGLGHPDFEWLAKRWSSWCIENLQDNSLTAGLLLAGALATFAHCPAMATPPEAPDGQ